MPCPMSLSTAGRRPSPLPPSSPQDDERQRHAFLRWLSPPPPADNLAPDDDTPSSSAHQVLALELVPYQAQLEHLGQFSQSTVTLRLTNGPLAGLEVCATALADTLHLQVRAPDRARFEQVAGSSRDLEIHLAQRFNRPVTLEVVDAFAATE